MTGLVCGIVVMGCAVGAFLFVSMVLFWMAFCSRRGKVEEEESAEEEELEGCVFIECEEEG